jgi:hypothetical protein
VSLERKHIKGKNFDNHISIIYCWIKLIFGYVVLLNVLYIFIGGSVGIRFHMRDIAGGNFLEKHPFKIVLVTDRLLLHPSLD